MLEAVANSDVDDITGKNTLGKSSSASSNGTVVSPSKVSFGSSEGIAHEG